MAKDLPVPKASDLFNQMKDGLLSLDPVAFCEKKLTLEGMPFKLNGNGYKPFIDIYRYLGIKALEQNAKPVVMVKGRQVGATVMACALSLFFMSAGIFGINGKPPIRVMHCFPLLEMAYTYAKTKLNIMIKSAVPIDPNSRNPKSYVESKLDKAASKDSLQFKQFENGNFMFIDSTGLTGDRLRGRSCDIILFDECQDTTGEAISNSTKSLAKSHYGPKTKGIQLYFGTPKQKGTDFHKIWKSSNQQLYHLGCAKCHEYFPLHIPETDDWEKIWIEDSLPEDHPSHGYIVQCPKCGFQQDKREAVERGKWIALNEGDTKMVGYHINQLYMPEYKRQDILDQKPENHPIMTERAYRNEVLGDFFAGEGFIITPEQVRELCADMDREISLGLEHNPNRKVYLGLDWGEKVDLDQFIVGEKKGKRRGQSYSTAVILSTDGPYILSVEFAKILEKNEPEYKKMVVDQMFRAYNVDLAVGDIGYANDLMQTLQQSYGERVLASRAISNKMKNHVKFVDDIFPKEIQFERDYWIEELYTRMKNGAIRFPYERRSYERIAWLVYQCCSMDIKVTLDGGGNAVIRYVKGSTPNDGFMALLNAYIAYRYDATNGFSINDPSLMKNDPAKRQKASMLLAHLPMNRASNTFARH
jgi:hypothetical protein